MSSVESCSKKINLFQKVISPTKGQGGKDQGIERGKREGIKEEVAGGRARGVRKEWESYVEEESEGEETRSLTVDASLNMDTSTVPVKD